MNFNRKTLWLIDACGITFCAGLIALFYFAGVQPMLQNRDAAYSQLKQLDIQRRRAGAAEASLRTLKNQLESARADLAAVPLQLEESRHVNERLAKITSLAGARNLQIGELEPGTGVVDDRYEIVPIHLAGAGTYHNCALFLHDLHESLPDTGFNQMRLDGNPEDPAAPANFQFDLRWYAALSKIPAALNVEKADVSEPTGEK